MGSVLDSSESVECPRCKRRDRRQRYVRRFLAIFFVLIPIAAVAGIPVYVHPRTDPLRKADAIFILGGYGDRKPYGFSLFQQGWAPNVILSNPIGPSQPDAATMWIDRWCDSTGWGSELLPDPKPWPVSTKFCPNPDPPTTLGEARAFRKLAEEHGWKSVIVVTFRPHIARARLIFERCFSGDVTMAVSPVDISTTQWVYEYFYQSAGFVKALVGEDC